MEEKSTLKLKSLDLLYFSIYSLIILECLPISMCLPGIIRGVLQITTIGSFMLGLALNINKKYLKNYCMVVFFATFFVYGVWGFRESIVTCAFNVMAGWEFCFFGIILYKSTSKVRKSRLLKFILALFVITAITTLIGLEKFPLAVRELGRSTRGYSLAGEAFQMLKWEYKFNNISGWNHLYGMVYIIPNLIVLYKQYYKKSYLFCLLVIELCIFRSQLTFALLLSLFMFVFTVYRPKVRFIYSLIVLFLLSVFSFVFFNLDMIIMYVAEFAKRLNLLMLSNKLNDLYMLFQGTVGGDALGRFTLYSISLNTFLNYPVIGSFLFKKNDGSLFSLHSDFFDMLGFYGLLGLLVLIYLVRKYCLFVEKNYNGDGWINNVLLVAFIAMFVFNPIWYSPQIFVGTFLLPSLIMKETVSVGR